jgi:hypothetical protein
MAGQCTNTLGGRGASLRKSHPYLCQTMKAIKDMWKLPKQFNFEDFGFLAER